jgi:quercetin dioxygenase-like cupin family protein
VDEASSQQTRYGRYVTSDGWFVFNLADALAVRNEKGGAPYPLEPQESPFGYFGVNVRVLWPGQPNALYHSEGVQEAFLVLSGECTLIVEEQERALRQRDYFHCPANTRHVFVGAGDGSCRSWATSRSALGSARHVRECPLPNLRLIENPHGVDVRAAHSGGSSGRSPRRKRTTPTAVRYATAPLSGSQTRSAMRRRGVWPDDACIREGASARAALPPRSPWTEVVAQTFEVTGFAGAGRSAAGDVSVVM